MLTDARLISKNSVQLKNIYNYIYWDVSLHVLHKTQNQVISIHIVVLQRIANKFIKIYNAHCNPKLSSQETIYLFVFYNVNNDCYFQNPKPIVCFLSLQFVLFLFFFSFIFLDPKPTTHLYCFGELYHIKDRVLSLKL